MDTPLLAPSSSSSSSLETNEPLAKKPREVSPPAREVYFICRSESFENSGYNIYVVDLNSSVESSDPFSSIPRDPTLRLDDGCFDDGRIHDEHTLCVLGSTLYIIEGCDRSIDINPTDKRRRSVFTVELPSSFEKVSGLRLEKSMIEEAPHMHYPKYFPVAVPTPDGKKLVVLSSVIDLRPRSLQAADRCDFELYDTANGLWRKLPGLYESLGDDRLSQYSTASLVIITYAFISESVLFLRTQAEMFSLDLESEDGWKEMDSFYGARHFPPELSLAPYFLVIGDGLCLTPFHAYDVGLSRFFHFPQRSPPPEFDAFTGHALALLDVDDNVECNFCIAQTVKMRGHTELPVLIIDVYKCDLIKYKEARKEEEGKTEGDWEMGDEWITGENSLPPGTTLIKSLKFPLNVPGYSLAFPPYLFSIRGGTN